MSGLGKILDEKANQDADTDSAGRSNRQITFSLQLHTDEGILAPPLAIYVGAIWMNDGETAIEFPFSGWLRREDGWQDGTWLAAIEGKRLGSILDQVSEGRRVSVKKTGPVEDRKKPQVDSVAIRALE